MLRSGLRKVVDIADALIWAIRPYRNRVIAKWVDTGQQNPLEAAVLRHFNEAYYTSSEAEQDAILGLLWNDKVSANYANLYQHKPWGREYFGEHPLELNYWGPLWDFIDSHLASTRGLTILQLGTSSGREVAYFAGRHPQHQFIGTDLSEQATARCNEFWKRIPNLTFQVLDVRRLEEFKTIPDLCISSAMICLLQPKRLDAFFSVIGAHWPHALVCIDEPVGGSYCRGNLGYSLKLDKESVPRGTANWSHNYCVVARRAGFEVLMCEEHNPCSYEYLVTTNNYRHAFLRRAHVVARYRA